MKELERLFPAEIAADGSKAPPRAHGPHREGRPSRRPRQACGSATQLRRRRRHRCRRRCSVRRGTEISSSGQRAHAPIRWRRRLHSPLALAHCCSLSLGCPRPVRGLQAKLLKSAVVKTPRSVYAAIPGRNKFWPSQETPIANLALAGACAPPQPQVSKPPRAGVVACRAKARSAAPALARGLLLWAAAAAAAAATAAAAAGCAARGIPSCVEPRQCRLWTAPPGFATYVLGFRFYVLGLRGPLRRRHAAPPRAVKRTGFGFGSGFGFGFGFRMGTAASPSICHAHLSHACIACRQLDAQRRKGGGLGL